MTTTMTTMSVSLISRKITVTRMPMIIVDHDPPNYKAEEEEVMRLLHNNWRLSATLSFFHFNALYLSVHYPFLLPLQMHACLSPFSSMQGKAWPAKRYCRKTPVSSMSGISWYIRCIYLCWSYTVKSPVSIHFLGSIQMSRCHVMRTWKGTKSKYQITPF